MHRSIPGQNVHKIEGDEIGAERQRVCRYILNQCQPAAEHQNKERPGVKERSESQTLTRLAETQTHSVFQYLPGINMILRVSLYQLHINRGG